MDKAQNIQKDYCCGLKEAKKVNIVVGQSSLPQTMFANVGNRSPCVSNWRFSVCERNIAHLTGSTTKNGLYGTPKTDKQNRDITKKTTNKKSKRQVSISNSMKKAQYI